MDMRFYWLRCRTCQKQFHIYWRRGVDILRKQFNLADYPTKHYPTKHHIAVRPIYVINNIQMKKPTHVNAQFKLQRIKNATSTLLQECAKTR